MQPGEAFLRACALDVAVQKPGNVSRLSAGHGMRASQFLRSAHVAVGPLCARGQGVGARIEGAVRATQAAVGCNTNLGILLLCAPIVATAQALEPGAAPDRWPAALERTLAAMDLKDSEAAYRAIALAQPGGLGRAAEQDVHLPPSLPLRDAMALAAGRDRIALQYRDGFGELFTEGLPALPVGFDLPAGDPDAATTAAVQRLYLRWLATAPDTHIVRKHGAGLAQTVMLTAQGWSTRLGAPVTSGDEAGLAAWDLELKQAGVNPGTSADLTVATLMLAGLLERRPHGWHGS